MDTEYIAALIRRGDLGRAAHIALAIAIATDCRFGPVVKAPVAELAEMLGCSYRQAERLKMKAVRWRLVEVVGKQGLRLVHPSQWRHTPLPDGATSWRDSMRHNEASCDTMRRDNDATPRRDNDAIGRHIAPQDGAVTERHIPPVIGRHIAPHQEGFPPDLLSLRPGTYMGKETSTGGGVPTPAKDGTATSASTDSFPKIESESTDNEHGWAFAAAKRTCKFLGLQSSDANGIGAELRRHGDLLESAISLLDDIAANAPDGGWTSGAQIVTEFRQRWPEWTTGPAGPAYQTWASEPDLPEDDDDALR